MNIFKAFLLISLFCVLKSGIAADIGFGTIKGIKVYDFSNSKVTKLYLSDDSIRKVEAQCNGVGHITHSKHDSETTQKMMSVAISAYMANKKVRLFSQDAGSCEVHMISLQQAYF